MKCGFTATDILLPGKAEYDKWAVIACDQFTSDKEYWKRVERFAANVPSTLNLVIPEIYLEDNTQARICGISETMDKYIADGCFTEHTNAFVYVERTLLNGMVRPGIVGAVDLEQYHYDPTKKPSVGATEQTIMSRVPPRIAVRSVAALEFSHVILFCSDFDNRILKPLSENKEKLPRIYDFDLMEGGGHISGWLVTGEQAARLQDELCAYQNNAEGTAFLVADGNHSLVTAKCWYEELKQKNPGADLADHPARYALVELENIFDPSIDFEPIHRVIFDVDTRKLVEDLQKLSVPGGCAITWVAGQEQGEIFLDVPHGELPVAVLQNYLDSWLEANAGRIDYVHDKDAVEKFAIRENTVGLLLPVFDKSALFAFGAAGKILPRKTFSLGHGREKRYYLEGRKIR